MLVDESRAVRMVWVYPYPYAASNSASQGVGFGGYDTTSVTSQPLRARPAPRYFTRRAGPSYPGNCPRDTMTTRISPATTSATGARPRQRWPASCSARCAFEYLDQPGSDGLLVEGRLVGSAASCTEPLPILRVVQYRLCFRQPLSNVVKVRQQPICAVGHHLDAELVPRRQYG